MRQGWDLGGTVGGWGCQNFFFFQNSFRFGVWVTYMNGTCTDTIFWVPAPWGLGEGSKIKFLNMVMWHIKLKGMGSIPGYTEKFNLQSNWWPWDGVKGSITTRFLRERGDLQWRTSNVFSFNLIFLLFISSISVNSPIFNLHLSFSSLVLSLFLLTLVFVGLNLARTRMNCLKFTVSSLLKEMAKKYINVILIHEKIQWVLIGPVKQNILA